jgi:hypothetical protein
LSLIGIAKQTEILMRIRVLAMVAIGAAAIIRPAEAQTYDPDYPVCLHVYDRAGLHYYDCRYTSLPQCNLSASGRAAQCVVNPYYANADREPSERHTSRHRAY